MTYDSTEDTRSHIREVQDLLSQVITELNLRSQIHDSTKLEDPEKSLFDKYTPLLRDLTYGSDEYKKTVAEMGEALAHHYDKNSHHPEHYPERETEESKELRHVIEAFDKFDPALPYLFSQLDELESRVNGMSLLDVLEMLADWKAAGMRHKDGSLAQSLEINRGRFKISPQLFEILKNTVRELGW